MVVIYVLMIHMYVFTYPPTYLPTYPIANYGD